MFKWFFKLRNKYNVRNNFKFLLEQDDPYKLAADTSLERYIMYIKDQLEYLLEQPIYNLNLINISKEFSLLYLEICIKEDPHKFHKAISNKIKHRIQEIINKRTTLIDAYEKIIEILEQKIG